MYVPVVMDGLSWTVFNCGPGQSHLDMFIIGTVPDSNRVKDQNLGKKNPLDLVLKRLLTKSGLIRY